jgi:hypothetical protein
LNSDQEKSDGNDYVYHKNVEKQNNCYGVVLQKQQTDWTEVKHPLSCDNSVLPNQCHHQPVDAFSDLAA